MHPTETVDRPEVVARVRDANDELAHEILTSPHRYSAAAVAWAQTLVGPAA